MHPYEHDAVDADTSTMRAHDLDVDQYDCDGCLDRVEAMKAEAEQPYQVEDGKGGWRIVQHAADPNSYSVRWLAERRRRRGREW